MNQVNYFLIFAFLFFVGSLLGWCIELVFRKFFSKNNPGHKWINPGFLVGPYLPLYGSGLCVLYFLATLPVENVTSIVWKQKLLLFVVMAVAMTLIEYVTGLIFIKGMHVKLWDYSENWGNIDGIICPLFSFFWAVLGALYYFLIHPYILTALAWLSRNLAFSFVIGMFYGVFLLDVVYSLQVVSKIKQFAQDYELVFKYEELKAVIRDLNEKRSKPRFLFAFRTDVPFHEHVKRYLELQATFGEVEIKERLERAAEKARKRTEETTRKTLEYTKETAKKAVDTAKSMKEDGIKKMGDREKK